MACLKIPAEGRITGRRAAAASDTGTEGALEGVRYFTPVADVLGPD
jgi:hypothetical protein